MELKTAEDRQILTARMAQLEAQNRRIKWMGTFALVLVCAVLLMGQRLPEGRTVKAEEFLIIGRDGKPRMILGLDHGSPRLTLIYTNGKTCAELAVSEDGEPFLKLNDRRGKTRIQLLLAEKGVSSLNFYDEDKRSRAKVGLSDNGSPSFLLRDARGKSRTKMFLGESGSPNLVFRNADGNVVFKAP